MSKRRALTSKEKELINIQIKNIDIKILQPKQVSLFKSICSQYEYDGCLSDKQISAMKNLKYAYDMAKRSKAIGEGRLICSDEIAARTDIKLNSIYNNIGR
jgi:hypothetical protein